MVKNKKDEWYCSKEYPRLLQDETTTNDDGYPCYRRRQGSLFLNRRGQRLDNSWIIPYNPWLTAKYDAHVNVEICSSIKAVKYLYKYVHKGHDRANVALAKSSVRDEITDFQDARYISACEAMWRLFRFPMCGHSPKVVRLQVHLEGQHTIIYRYYQVSSCLLCYSHS